MRLARPRVRVHCVVSFLLIVAVICLLALFVLLLAAGGASRVADRAAVLAARGDTEEARGLLFAAKGSQDDPSALFVRACLELEEGRPDSASAIAVRLRSMKPEAPELLVLSKLISTRRSSTRVMIDAEARDGISFRVFRGPSPTTDTSPWHWWWLARIRTRR